MTMRETIARAIADFVGHHPWPVMAAHRGDLRDKVRSGFDYDVNEPTQSDCLEAAGAVLAALRTPTEAMEEALFLHGWEAAIDAASKEQAS